jgi:hypothetical protein
VFKIVLIVLGLGVLVVTGLTIWQWQVASVVLTSKGLEGDVKAAPDAAAAALPEISKGPADWICWRGAAGDARSRGVRIAGGWPSGMTKRWEVAFLCQGRGTASWSAPVVQGNRLVVCGRDEANDLVFCLNPDDGRPLWKASYPAAAASTHGSGPRATPWVDEDRAYTFGRSGDLVCWKLKDGEKLWHRNVRDEGGKEPKWGYASSPLVTDSVVVVSAGGRARTIAYDKMTGDVKWQTGKGAAGYAAISRMTIQGKPVLLVFHGAGLSALDAEDGRELWQTPWVTSYEVNATTPVAHGDLVFISSGYGTGGEVLRVTLSGAEVVWKNKTIASHHSDPYIIDGQIYGYSGMSMQNKGYFKCVELLTGEEKWSTGEMGWGTCIYVDGHLLCCDIKGNLFLMKPDPEKFVEVAAKPKVLGRVRAAAWTRPVLANGRLYLRYKQKLLCFDFE